MCDGGGGGGGTGGQLVVSGVVVESQQVSQVLNSWEVVPLSQVTAHAQFLVYEV